MRDHEIGRLAALEDRHWWYAERRTILRRQLKRVPNKGWALDVGAAAGGNTRVLEAAGYRAIALERAASGAELARRRGLRCVRGDATHLPFPAGVLSAIVAYDVLEHIEQDLEAAREMNRCLRPDGALLVTVPADMRLWSSHDEAVDHFRRYGRTELHGLLTRAGFRDVSIRSWNVLLRPAIVWRRKRSQGSDLDDPSRIVNATLRSIVATERVLPVGGLPGVSLVATARR